MPKHNVRVELSAVIERLGMVGALLQLEVEGEGNSKAILQLLLIGYMEIAEKVLKEHPCSDCPFAKSTINTVKVLKDLNRKKALDFLRTTEEEE